LNNSLSDQDKSGLNSADFFSDYENYASFDDEHDFTTASSLDFIRSDGEENRNFEKKFSSANDHKSICKSCVAVWKNCDNCLTQFTIVNNTAEQLTSKLVKMFEVGEKIKIYAHKLEEMDWDNNSHPHPHHSSAIPYPKLPPSHKT
jgi:hypothetical protein